MNAVSCRCLFFFGGGDSCISSHLLLVPLLLLSLLRRGGKGSDEWEGGVEGVDSTGQGKVNLIQICLLAQELSTDRKYGC